MFGLLNPFILWLAPLLAAPLIIHFLGRAEPKTRDFPSLIPVQGQLLRAMQRHRLKNWLQLILRTLALLCLLLAGANLVWRSPSLWTPPETTALLIHNGIYGALTAPVPGQPQRSRTMMEAQETLRRSLDSLTPGRGLTERVIPEVTDARAVDRFGSYPDALTRLLGKVNASSTPHIFLPLFDARDLHGMGEILKPWLERHPRARVAVIDYTAEKNFEKGLSPFGKVDVSLDKEGQVALRVAWTDISNRTPPVWIPEGGSARETHLRDGFAEILLPLVESKDQSSGITGIFKPGATDHNQYPQPFVAVSYQIPATATYCILSPATAWISRATMGASSRRLKIRAFGSSAELDDYMKQASCRLLYLADPENLEASVPGHASAVLRAGGKVILGTGRHTDIALLNRNLLQPLGVGRLTQVETHASMTAHPHPEALAMLGVSADTWGRPGAVRMHLGFQPKAGTTTLLSMKGVGTKSGEEIPLLVHRRLTGLSSANPGEILLWTTDLADPAWSDLGLGPWAALVHQAFAARTGATEATFLDVSSDSNVWLALPADQIERMNNAGEVSGARLLDPAGHPIHSWRLQDGGITVGPFDRTGLYRLESDSKSIPVLEFSVNLAPERLQPLASTQQTASWKAFYTALGNKAAAQIERIPAVEDWRALYGGFRLRLPLLILAALLLFVEGVVSLRLSPFRN